MYNPWFHKYPGTNFHEQNIDWVVDQIKNLMGEMKNFEAVNQIRYIGVWDITAQYGPWNVVTYNNDGYISVQPVPAGIAITNLDYWKKISDYTAEMAALQSRVSGLESDMATAQNDINTLKADVIGKDMKDRVILFIGDSWGEGWNPDEGTVTSPETVCGDLLGCTYYRQDEGGAGFAYANGHWYGKLMEDFVGSQSQTVIDSITDIIITGGQNDLGDSNDWVNSNGTYECAWCAQYIQDHFPKAKVWIGYVARTSGWNADATYGNLYRTINRYQEACRKYNWHYINRSHLMIHDYRYLSSDGKHLLEAGYKYLGEALAQSILSGDYRIEPRGVLALDIEAAADTSGTLINDQVTNINIQQWLSPDGVLIYNDTNKIWDITTDTTLGANTLYTLCEYTMQGFFKSLYKFSINIDCVVVASGVAEIVPASLYFQEGGTVQLRLMKTGPDGSSWATFTDVSRIIFQPFSFVIPIDYC